MLAISFWEKSELVAKPSAFQILTLPRRLSHSPALWQASLVATVVTLLEAGPPSCHLEVAGISVSGKSHTLARMAPEKNRSTCQFLEKHHTFPVAFLFKKICFMVVRDG